MDLQHHSGHAVSTYLEQEITNEDALGRVARLYEMAGLEVSRARASLGAGNHKAKGAAVRRALRCIALLQSSLNMDAGGEVAGNLDRIYTYLTRRLTDANLKSDEEAFAEVAGHLSELGAAWRQAAIRQPTVRPAASVATGAAAR